LASSGARRSSGARKLHGDGRALPLPCVAAHVAEGALSFPTEPLQRERRIRPTGGDVTRSSILQRVWHADGVHSLERFHHIEHAAALPRAEVDRLAPHVAKALHRAQMTDREIDDMDVVAQARAMATPDLRVGEERLTRALAVQEEVFVTLTKQLELARIQEQEDQVSVQVIEPAVAPL